MLPTFYDVFLKFQNLSELFIFRFIISFATLVERGVEMSCEAHAPRGGWRAALRAGRVLPHGALRKRQPEEAKLA